MAEVRRKGGVLVTNAPLNEELLKGTKYSLESILVEEEEKYYHNLTFEKKLRLSTIKNFFTNGNSPTFCPKPGREVSKDLYYKCDGSIKLGDNYFLSGKLTPKETIQDLVSKLGGKLTEAMVIEKIKKLICREDAKGDGTHVAHRSGLLETNIPQHLNHRRTRIIKELDSFYEGGIYRTMKEAEERFAIIINGDSRTGKTKLAQLIIKTMAKSKLINNERSYIFWKQQDLSDKLPRLLGKEVVVLDDYDGENHKFGVFDALTCPEPSQIRVMGNYESTRYVKGAIVPTVDMLETGITGKTGTLRKFQQIYFRAECNIYLFKRKDIKTPTGDDYKDRLFYIGNIRRGVYKTLMGNLDISDEPLGSRGKDTPLARSLDKLIHKVVGTLYQDKKYWDGYFDRAKIPTRFGSLQPETKLGTQPDIIRMFSLPSYDWLRELVNKMDVQDLKLPLKGISGKETFTAEEKKKLTEKMRFTDPELTIDIETEPIKDSPLKKLEVKSVQIDDVFKPTKHGDLSKLVGHVSGKTLVAFNAPFEQTQLRHQGFPSFKQKGVDVALLARFSDNTAAEERVASLADGETRILGTTSKRDLVAKLKKEYGKNYFAHPQIEESDLFKEYALNDTKITKELYHNLKGRVNWEYFTRLQQLQDKLTKGASRGIPFPRERLENLSTVIRKRLYEQFKDLLDIRPLGGKSKVTMKGGSSTLLKTNYIRKYRTEWLPFLETTPKGAVKFDKEARAKLIKVFPDDKVLQVVQEVAKLTRAKQQLTKLLDYAEKDKFYPNYTMLGTATGRFTASKPELHNLLRKEPYNIRDTLLADKNVFAIDFKSQEDRMAAYLANDSVDIEDFKQGADVHRKLAERIGIYKVEEDREKGKRIRHSSRYGAGVGNIQQQLGIRYSQAEEILDNYRQKYHRTFDFIDSLEDVEEVTSSIYQRPIRFSQYKGYTKFNGIVQGNCTDLLLRALEGVLESDKVKLRGHFHDSLYLACLCQGPHPGCQQSKEVVRELETLYEFYGPQSKIPVFKFGDIEGVGRKGT